MNRTEIVEDIANNSTTLLGYALKLTGCESKASDLLQEMYLTILSYDERKLKDIYRNNKQYYLCARIMKFTHFRRAKKTVQLEYVDNVAELNPTNEAKASLSDEQLARKILGRELWKLEKFNRTIFYLYSIEKLSIRKMAKATKINRGIIYKALCQARKQFQENLTDQEIQLLKQHLSLKS